MKKLAVLFCLFFAVAAATAETGDGAAQQETIKAQAVISCSGEEETAQQQTVPPPQVGQEAQVQDESGMPAVQQKEIKDRTQTKSAGKFSKDSDRWCPYVRMDAGFTYATFTVEDNDLSGWQGLYNIGLGAKYKRARFDLAYQTRATITNVLLAPLYNVTVYNQALMANAYYDFVSAPFFALYIGGGAGMNNWEYEIKDLSSQTEKENGTSFIGGIYLGASINVPVKVVMLSIDFGVDYYYIEKPMMNSFVPKIGARLTF